jgi:Na+/H+-dicarboxylate symporter
MCGNSINVLGNCLAGVVVVRWKGEFDCAKAQRFGESSEAQS